MHKVLKLGDVILYCGFVVTNTSNFWSSLSCAVLLQLCVLYLLTVHVLCAARLRCRDGVDQA